MNIEVRHRSLGDEPFSYLAYVVHIVFCVRWGVSMWASAHGPPAPVSRMLGCHTCYCAQLLPERTHSGLDIDGSLEWY